MTAKEFSELLADFQKLASDNTNNTIEHHLSARFSWIKVQMFDVLNLSESNGGLPAVDRIEMANATLKGLEEFMVNLERSSEGSTKLY